MKVIFAVVVVFDQVIFAATVVFQQVVFAAVITFDQDVFAVTIAFDQVDVFAVITVFDQVVVDIAFGQIAVVVIFVLEAFDLFQEKFIAVSLVVTIGFDVQILGQTVFDQLIDVDLLIDVQLLIDVDLLAFGQIADLELFAFGQIVVADFIAFGQIVVADLLVFGQLDEVDIDPSNFTDFGISFMAADATTHMDFACFVLDIVIVSVYFMDFTVDFKDNASFEDNAGFEDNATIKVVPSSSISFAIREQGCCLEARMVVVEFQAG